MCIKRGTMAPIITMDTQNILFYEYLNIQERAPFSSFFTFSFFSLMDCLSTLECELVSKATFLAKS